MTLGKHKDAGKTGAGCTRSLVCNKESTQVSNHRFNRSNPAFPARWFTTYCVLPGVRDLIVTVARKASLARLAPAQGCQDHTLSPSARHITRQSL
jgi:hypothetical protein